jgi:hypothetical protein
MAGISSLRDDVRVNAMPTGRRADIFQKMLADVFPHLVMPVGPFVAAFRAPVVQMMSYPPAREHAAERSRQGHFFGFALRSR